MASILTKGMIKTEIRACLGGRTDFDSRMDNVLRLAIMTMARMHEFDELRFIATYATAVTADPIADSQINLVQGLNRVRKIYTVRLYSGTESRKLVKLNPRRFDALIPKVDVVARGKPTHYCIYNKNTMELWRCPDAVYTIKIRQSLYPEFPTDDSQTFVFDNAEDLIIYLSASYLALTAGNIQRSNELYKAFANAAVQVFKEEVEDFDTHMAVHGTEIHGSILGTPWANPFVNSTYTGE
jgi:hypothetical protein